MNTQHTPEPWENPQSAEFSGFLDQYYCIIRAQENRLWQKILGRTAEEANANAKRIVACVNACKGMTDPEKQIRELRITLDAILEECQQWEFSKQTQELIDKVCTK